jgi:hypothetical protein
LVVAARYMETSGRGRRSEISNDLWPRGGWFLFVHQLVASVGLLVSTEFVMLTDEQAEVPVFLTYKAKDVLQLFSTGFFLTTRGRASDPRLVFLTYHRLIYVRTPPIAN